MELSLDFMDCLVWAQNNFGNPPFRPGQDPFGPGFRPGDQRAAAAAGGIFAMGLAGMLICGLVYFAILFVMIASMWKTFTKAGEPGWAAIVPIYNLMIMGKISGKGEVYGLMCLIPCVGIVFGIILTIEFAKQFGKDVGYAIGMILLPIVFWPMLGFGSARYIGGRARPKRRAYDDDDDDDDRPRRASSRRDDDDEDRPRKAPPRRRDDDDDDDPPRREQVRRR